MYNKQILLTKKQNIMQKFLRTLALMALVVVPWVTQAQVLNEGFEGGWPPDDWTTIHVSGSGAWSKGTSSGGHNGSSAFAYRSDVSGGFEDYLITPQLAPVAGDELSFYLASQYAASYPGTVITVEVSTTTPTVDAFTTVLATYDGSFASSATSWVNKTVDVSDYIGQAIYIAFHVVDPSYDADVRIDDVSGVSLYVPACATPNNLLVSEIGPNSAKISWTERGLSTSWQICVNGDEENLINTNTNPYTLTGLTAGTGYSVKVRANCAESDWSTVESFTTTSACPTPYDLAATNITAHTATLGWTGFSDSYNVRYVATSGLTEGFESGSLPDGWIANLSSSSSGVKSGGPNHTGSLGFAFYYNEQDASLISPLLSNTENGATLSFYYKEQTNSYGDEQFYVGYTTDENVTDPDDFTYGDIVTASMEWELYELTLPAGTKRFAIKYVYNDAMYLFIDDIEVSAPSGDWTTVAANSTSFSFAGLAPETKYLVQVQGVCGSTTTDWSNPASFTTLIACPAVPFENIDMNSVVVTAHEVSFSWTPAASETSWIITVSGMDPITVNSPTVNITGLAGETQYEVSLVADCGAEEGQSTPLGLTVTTQIACPAPTTLANGTPTTGSVELSWTAGAEETAWQLCINGDEEHLRAVTTNPFTLEGLTPSTDYTVKVRANCGGVDGVSAWSNEVTFTTAAACPAPVLAANGITNVTAHTADVEWTGFDENNSYVVSYRTKSYLDGITETFSTSSPAGWLKRTGVLNNDGTATLSGSSSWSIGNNSSVFDSHPYLNMYGTKNYWLISPSMTIGDNYALNFDVAYTKYNSGTAANMGCPTHRFAVLISTDNMATWTILREWNNSGSAYVLDEISYTGEPVSSIDLSAYAGQNAYIAFFAHSETNAYDNNFHFDNVAIGAVVPAGEWRTENTTATNVTLENLNAETLYEVNVKGKCAGNAESLESDMQSFTTDIACPAPTGLALIGEPTTNSVKLSWTENGSATAWQLCLDGDEDHLGSPQRR